MDEKLTDENLREYTVRLEVDRASGTGFFVAPGLILTCAHVVADVGERDDAIALWWQNNKYAAVIEKLPADPKKVDLALLKFRDRAPDDHPWVHLDDRAPKLGDRLFTFGYPDEHKNGDPCEFEYVGLMGDDPPLLKFKEGQVRPGLSGSPLLHVRTGKVCGIVKSTRDRNNDLGGRAVPATVIFREFPELRPTSPPPPPSNPFIPLAGRVDDRRLFFDRLKEIRNVFEIINSGSSVAVIGDRGIGKSSLLLAICREAEGYLHQFRESVYLNLELVADENDFYKALCEEVGIEESRGYALTRALKNRRLLLAIDKVEKMTWDKFSSQIPSQLRGLADGSDAPLRLVLAARKSLDNIFQETEKVSPLTNICIEVNLGLWNSDLARAFIAERLDSTPVTFSEEEISQIILASKGHPQKLMTQCYQTYEGYKEKMP